MQRRFVILIRMSELEIRKGKKYLNQFIGFITTTLCIQLPVFNISDTVGIASYSKKI